VSETDSETPAASAKSQIASSLGNFLGSTYNPESLSEATDKEAFHDRFNHRMVHLGLRRQHNIEAVAEAAFDAAKTQGQGDVDGDWLARFLSYAEQVGNVDMQQVWGYILATEYENPGTVSLSSLACLSNMVSSDLDLWERIGRMTFPEGYVFKVGGRNRFERFDISADNIVHLQTIGLLQEAQDLSITFSADTKGLTFPFQGADIILRHPELELFTLPAFKLSSAGLQLFKLLTDSPVNEDYLRAFGTELKPNGYDYRIRLADGSLVE
jgi:hypothetical protein